MSVLESISVDVVVVLGSAQVPIRQVLKMGRGAMISFDCSQDDPSLVYVNNELVATGRVLVSHDIMSLEVLEVVRKGRR